MDNEEAREKNALKEKLDELVKLSQEYGLYDDPETYHVTTPNLAETSKVITENRRLREDLEETNNKLNFYFTCILKASLILEKVTNKKWDNNVESIVQQAQEVCNYLESKEDTKDPTETLKNQIRYLENRVSHLTKIVRGYSKFLEELAED